MRTLTTQTSMCKYTVSPGHSLLAHTSDLLLCASAHKEKRKTDAQTKIDLSRLAPACYHIDVRVCVYAASTAVDRIIQAFWKGGSYFYVQRCVWGMLIISHAGLPLGGRTPYITSKNRLCTPKLHIKDVPRTSENSLVRPKMDIETSCLQKKPAHIYQIT